MEFEKNDKLDAKGGRFVKSVRTLKRVFKTKFASETTRQRILKVADLESRYNEQVKLRKEAEEALAGEKEEQRKLQLQAKALEQRLDRELLLRKDTEVDLATEQVKIEKLKIRLAALETEHNDIKDKAGELESKYTSIKQELVEAKDNALMLLEEMTTKQMEESQPPSSFFCPISLEVMKDPHLTADGHTYEAEFIKRWFARGKHTSPKTNLKLPHRNLVPNRALQSAIQDLVPPSFLSDLD